MSPRCMFPVLQINEISKRREYGGKVRDRVLGLAEACHGGQVIIDSPTFEGITNSMVDIISRIPHEPDFASIAEHARWVLLSHQCLGSL